MSHLPACWGVHSKFPRLPHRVSARPTGARGVGSASRGRARLVDRLFTPLGTRRVFMDAWSAIGTFAVAEARALFVLFCETSTELVVPKRTPELDKICARTAARRTECPKTCSIVPMGGKRPTSSSARSPAPRGARARRYSQQALVRNLCPSAQAPSKLGVRLARTAASPSA